MGRGKLLLRCAWSCWLVVVGSWLSSRICDAHALQKLTDNEMLPTPLLQRFLDGSSPLPGTNRPSPPGSSDGGSSRDRWGPMPIIQTVDNGETQLTQSIRRWPRDGGPGGNGGGPPPPGPRPDRPLPPGRNICGQTPYLLTRNDVGGATSNGNCDNAANSTILSCTCFDGLNGTDSKEWNFVLALKDSQASSTAPPTSMSISDRPSPLPINSITTLQAPVNLQTIRFIGDGKTPLPIKFELSGMDTDQLVTLIKVAGQTPQLTTVEIANLDMFKLVLGNGFLPRTITNLTMRNCNLSAIYTGFLTSFQQLTILDVSKNHLSNILDGLLQGSCGSSSCSIQELNLNDNNFTKIPDLLTSLTNLKTVRMTGNPIHSPAEVPGDLFKFIQRLDTFEFNETGSGNATKEQENASDGSPCSNNGIVQQAHRMAFCVLSSTSSSGPTVSSGSSDGKISVLVLVLIVIGSVVAFVVSAVFIKFLFFRSRDGPDMTFTSRMKHTQEGTTSVYGAGDGTMNYERPGYERFEEEKEDTYSYDDDGGAGIDLSLLQDPFLVTARIPLDAIRFGACMKKGGFGVVYGGIYNRRKVAIKKLRSDRSANLRNVENFIKEVCLIASLKHPRIVEFIGVAWDSLRNFCAITELMEKGDLKQVLVSFSKRKGSSKGNVLNLFKRKRAADAASDQGDGSTDESSTDDNTAIVSVSEEAPQSMEFPEFSWQNHKRSIMSHVAEALTYLHSLQPKVIHRDLKSKNILLNKSMEAKLSDFGIARERKIDESHMMTAGVGTSFWIAPEVLLGKDYDERADIFSFGVVMCEMDTGEYPYRQMNQIAQAAQQAAGSPEEGSPPKAQPCNKYQYTTILQLVAHGQLRPEMSANCPSEIVDLANDCLAMDPDLRPTAAEIVYRLAQVHSPEGFLALSDGDDNDEEISLMEDIDDD